MKRVCICHGMLYKKVSSRELRLQRHTLKSVTALGLQKDLAAPRHCLSLNKCLAFSSFAYSCSFLRMIHPRAITGFILFVSGVPFQSIQAAVSSLGSQRPHGSNGAWV